MPLHNDDPRTLGAYRIVDRLGAGGMGVVYRARARSGREVALKVVHAQYAEDQVFRARFRQEIEAVRKVSGAFTAPVVDADPEAARPWMATQFVPGRSLADRIREGGPIRGAEARLVALGLVEALRDIHRAGVVHRDLKPANVLTADDGPRVIDFGISRAAENHNTLTETGQMIGTPPFMSPEQFTDARSVGPASDVFSLGALLAYSITGRGPFDADSPYLTAYRVVHNEPELDGVARPLRTVLERCLAKEAKDRPGLDELAQDFAAVLPEPDPTDPPTLRLRLDALRAVETFPGNSTDRTAVVADKGRTRRRPLRLAAAGGALALALVAELTYGPGLPGNWNDDSAARTDSRWQAVPDGWQKWQTTVFKTATWGEVNALGAADGPPPGSQSDCLSEGDAVYCAGDGVLPVRLDGRTGETVWRASLASPDTDPVLYNSSLLGVSDGVVLVRQAISEEGSLADPAHVIALDAEDGNQLWDLKVNDDNVDLTMSRDLVLTADGRKVTARTPRTGAERWTLRLPAGTYCTFLSAGSGLYAQCYPTTDDPRNSTLLKVNPTDGTVVGSMRVPFESGPLGVTEGLAALALAPDENSSVGLEDSTFGTILLTDPITKGRTTVRLKKTYEGSATLASDTLWITASNGEVTAVSPLTGRELWHTRTSVENSGSPTYDPRTPTLYLASPSGRVAALDTREGALLWETAPRVGGATGDDAASPTVLLYEGALTVMTPDGTLFSLDPAEPTA